MSLGRPLGYLTISEIIHVSTNEYQKIEEKLLSQSMAETIISQGRKPLRKIFSRNLFLRFCTKIARLNTTNFFLLEAN